ncbi:MAG: hypothetical protein JXA96_04780, partial [Sedimentisphaerales bacterium]|nr:hypothetical protein [Sedimentisphaerales bacterium]
MPLLFLLVSFSGRLIRRLILITRVAGLRKGNNKIPSEAQDFLKKVCTKNKLRKPALILTGRRDCAIELKGILFGLYPVIEISTAAIDILSVKELNSVLAHELGHLHHGLWKTEILKLLSSVLFFPNYYLTLCMNWAAMEIEADIFSLEATKDKTSLINALLKTSASQFSNTAYGSKKSFKEHDRLWNYLKVQLNSVLVSVRFFYGDRLLGYVHPNLSERLDAIENNLAE